MTKWAGDHEIETYYYKKRLDVKNRQENTSYLSEATKKENQRKENLRMTLEKYEVDDLKSSQIKRVEDLFAGKSPYKYNPEQQDEYSKVEPDIFDRA